MKTILLSDILTADQIAKARHLIRESEGTEFHKRVLAEIVLPAMPEINRKTGQENDAHFIAYVIEYALNKISEGR